MILTALSAISIGLELALSEPRPLPAANVDALSAFTAECSGDAPRDLRRSLGQRIVVRMEGEATPELLRQGRSGEIGGVVLFPPEGQDPDALAAEIARLQGAAAEASAEPLVIAIDQEGGEVKRLASLPPDRAPPRFAGDPAAAEEEGLATGRALAELGINVDLAPVLDVPAGPDSFLAARTFGTDPESVADAGAAFAAGLAQAGARATAKHFPGLGRSAVNTDVGSSEITATRPELRADLAPFERAIDDGIALVMFSSATYPELDPDSPAFASRPIAERLLRERLGFEGVTITDDLDAPGVQASFDRDGAALAAAQGGSDLLLFALTSSPGVLDGLVAAARRGELAADAVQEACVRVAELRSTLAG